MRPVNVVLLVATCLLAAVAVGAQSPTEVRGGLATLPLNAVSRGTVTVNGKAIPYTATVEETFALDQKGRPAASIISIAYVRTDVTNESARPVLFAFNGGPGSASIWLHLGLLGPKRVVFDDGVSDEEVHPRTTPPFSLTENGDTPLDVADVVLFDPPGTGLSRMLPGADEHQFFGVQQDAKLTSEFIQGWLTRHRRWNCPRFLLGESYGCVRAAVVAKILTGGPMGSGRMDGITLNGVILLGQAMNMGGADSPEIAAATVLPTLAATAWYHGKVDRDGRTLEQHVDAARTFAATQLLPALFAGERLPATERARIGAGLAALTGLPTEVIVAHDLRIDARLFASELLKHEGRRLGLYDGRFTLAASPDGSDPVADDPAMAQYVPSFVAAFSGYLADILGVKTDLSYNAIEFARVNAGWDYGGTRNYAGDLAIAMRRNPRLRLFVGTGYFDLVTTLGSADYVLSHSGIDPRAVTSCLFPSGHMSYIGVSSRTRLAAALREFILGAK